MCASPKWFHLKADAIIAYRAILIGLSYKVIVVCLLLATRNGRFANCVEYDKMVLGDLHKCLHNRHITVEMLSVIVFAGLNWQFERWRGQLAVFGCSCY